MAQVGLWPNRDKDTSSLTAARQRAALSRLPAMAMVAGPASTVGCPGSTSKQESEWVV